jgi:hypothetical protein
VTASRLARAIGLAIVAIGLGWGLAFGFVGLVNVIWPFRPEDADTPREFVPVAIAYFIWAVTATQVFLIGWRGIRNRP